MLASGLSQPYYLEFIDDASENLPYTVSLIIFAFIGLTVGYYSPLGVALGKRIKSFLPKRDYHPRAFSAPGTVLLLLGTLTTFLAIAIGISGYQKDHMIASYDGLIFLTTLFWLQGGFLLSYTILTRRDIDFQTILISSFFILMSIIRAMFSGSQGAFFQ